MHMACRCSKAPRMVSASARAASREFFWEDLGGLKSRAADRGAPGAA